VEVHYPKGGVVNREDIIDRLLKTPKFLTKDTFGNTVSMPNEITEQNAAERREAATEIFKLRKMLSEVTAQRDAAWRDFFVGDCDHTKENT